MTFFPTMKLRGTDFGHVLDASGVRGWFGEGYPFHRWIPGLSFDDSTFVAKTTTLNPRVRPNLMSSDGVTPRLWRQPYVRVNWRHGVTLNALGLPGPGFRALLERGIWQKRTAPFFLSFMAVEPTPQDSLREVREFVAILKHELPNFKAPVGLQVNFSCPNVHPREYVHNFKTHLREYRLLDIPIVAKLTATQSTDTALQIEEDCDGICVSNTIAWGDLPDKIDWNGLFGANESPLKQWGGGGLSGQPLLKIVAEWVHQIREQGFKKPINAGGGILKPSDVDILVDAGASSVFVGSIAMLRGWRLRRTIRRAQILFAAVERRDLEHIQALRHAS